MPFDVGLLAPEAAPVVTAAARVAAAFERAPDPDPVLAEANPDRLLAFLFVAPRECAAVDALLAR